MFGKPKIIVFVEILRKSYKKLYGYRKTRFPPGFAREARFRCSKTDVILGIGLLDNVVDGAEGVVKIYGDLDAPHARVVPEQDRDLGFFRKIGLHTHVQRPVLFPFAGLAARTPVRGMEG